MGKTLGSLLLLFLAMVCSNATAVKTKVIKEDFSCRRTLHRTPHHSQPTPSQTEILRQVQTSPLGIVVVGPKRTIVYSNDSFQHLTGKHPNELLGQHERTLRTDSGPMETPQNFPTITSGDKWTGWAVNQRQKKGGFEKYVAGLAVYPVTLETGETYFIGIQLDISDRFRAVWVYGHELANSLQVIIGTIDTLQEDIPASQPILKKALRYTSNVLQSTSHLLQRTIHKLRTKKDLNPQPSRLLPQHDVSNISDSTLAKVIWKVTQGNPLKGLEQEITPEHFLRPPLNVLQASINAIRLQLSQLQSETGFQPDPSLEQYIRKTLKLVSYMHKASQGEIVEMVLKQRTLEELRALVQNIAHQSNVTIKEEDITQTNSDKEQDILFAKGADLDALHFAIYNLVKNAKEAGANEVSLSLKLISLSQPNANTQGLKIAKYALLTATDNGTGMSQSQIEAFNSGTQLITTKNYGTGQGLANTRNIINSHGGYITVESLPSGRTTFRIYLPMAGNNETTAPTNYLDN